MYTTELLEALQDMPECQAMEIIAQYLLEEDWGQLRIAESGRYFAPGEADCLERLGTRNPPVDMEGVCEDCEVELFSWSKRARCPFCGRYVSLKPCSLLDGLGELR